jgi:hypothetical protein
MVTDDPGAPLKALHGDQSYRGRRWIAGSEREAPTLGAERPQSCRLKFKHA